MWDSVEVLEVGWHSRVCVPLGIKAVRRLD